MGHPRGGQQSHPLGLLQAERAHRGSPSWALLAPDPAPVGQPPVGSRRPVLRQAGQRRGSSQLVTFPTSLQDKPPPSCSHGCRWPCRQLGAPGRGDEVLQRASPAGLPEPVDAVCCASPAGRPAQVPEALRLKKYVCVPVTRFIFNLPLFC